MTPRLYLAGKINENDWRYQLVSNLRTHVWEDGELENNGFIYTGPFFVSCDHRCFHYPASHGAAEIPQEPNGYPRDQIARNNNASIDAADLVFAYISEPDCYGTLVEIGYAIAKKIRVVVAIAPNLPAEEFWYSSVQAVASHLMVRPCCLAPLVSEEVAKTKALLSKKLKGTE